MSRDFYQQHSLPPSTNSIRLLRLEECIYTSPQGEDLPVSLRYSFEIHDLHEKPTSVALSYEWGLESLVDDVFMVDGQFWPIRENLCDAILHIGNERAWQGHDRRVATREKYD
jgi:hypothetical protein